MLATMYDFAVEDCLYYHTCKNNVSIGILENRESDDVSPYKLGLQKIAFELRLGFENIESFTLQALLH